MMADPDVLDDHVNRNYGLLQFIVNRASDMITSPHQLIGDVHQCSFQETCGHTAKTIHVILSGNSECGVSVVERGETFTHVGFYVYFWTTTDRTRCYLRSFTHTRPSYDCAFSMEFVGGDAMTEERARMVSAVDFGFNLPEETWGSTGTEPRPTNNRYVPTLPTIATEVMVVSSPAAAAPRRWTVMKGIRRLVRRACGGRTPSRNNSFTGLVNPVSLRAQHSRSQLGQRLGTSVAYNK